MSRMPRINGHTWRIDRGREGEEGFTFEKSIEKNIELFTGLSDSMTLTNKVKLNFAMFIDTNTK